MAKTYKTGVQGKVDTLAAISKVVAPPIALSEIEGVFFETILHSRETVTWSKADLLAAAHLAKAYRRLKTITEQLDDEGFLLKNAKGNKMTNPLFSAWVQTQMLITSSSKALGITAPQRGLNEGAQRVRNRIEGAARDELEDSGDDLLQ